MSERDDGGLGRAGVIAMVVAALLLLASCCCCLLLLLAAALLPRPSLYSLLGVELGPLLKHF